MRVVAVILGILRALAVASLVALTPSVSFAQLSAQQTYISTSGGTNTITVTIPNVGSLADLVGVPLRVFVSGSNTGAATLTVNSLASTAVEKPTTAGLAALIGGEIVASQINTFMYDGTVFELVQPNLNITTVPATSGFDVVATNLQINCSAAANALTCAMKAANTSGNPSAIAPIYIPFESAPTIDGTPIWEEVTGAVSTTIAGGNNMGCATNGAPCRLWITAINNAGTVLLGLSDQSTPSKCMALNESALQTTGSGTSGGSTAGTIYTSVSVVGPAAIRIIGYVEWTSITTAGNWTTPNVVKLFGPGVKSPCSVVQGPFSVATQSTTSPTNATPIVTNLTLTFTPTSPVDLIMFDFGLVSFGNSANANGIVSALYHAAGASPACTTKVANTTDTGLAASQLSWGSIDGQDSPNTASQITYTICASNSNSANGPVFCYQTAGTQTCTLRLLEIMGALDKPVNDNSGAELRMVG